MVRPKRKGALAIAALLAVSTKAHASRTARLVYERDEAASSCPSRDTLEAAVAERLGRNPFRGDANATIRVAFSRVGDELGASVELTDERGAELGHRALASGTLDCTDLAESTVLTVTILLNPPTLPSADGAGHGDPRQPQGQVTDAPASQSPPTHADATLLRVGVGGLGAVGAAPTPSVGALVFAGVRWRAWSLDLEGRIDLPAERVYAEGTVEASTQLAAVAPCLHRGIIVACALAGAGVLGVDGKGVTAARSKTTIYPFAGARLGAEFALVAFLRARITADLIVPGQELP